VYEGFERKAVGAKRVRSQIRIGVNGVLIGFSETPLDTSLLRQFHEEDQQIGGNVSDGDYEPGERQNALEESSIGFEHGSEYGNGKMAENTDHCKPHMRRARPRASHVQCDNRVHVDAQEQSELQRPVRRESNALKKH